MYVIYLPFLDSFYGGCNGNTIDYCNYEKAMHFNSLFCSDWYIAFISLTKNDKKFIVMKVEYENI